MSPQLFADLGPPPGFVEGFLICVAVSAILLAVGVVSLGIWLSRRKRNRADEQREME